MSKSGSLSERGAQILGVLWELGKATAEQIRGALPAELHDSTVRTLLRQLEEKGFVTHEVVDRAFIYQPAVERESVQTQALRGFLKRFFGGSAEVLVQHLIRDEHLTVKALDEIRKSTPRIPVDPKRKSRSGGKR